MKSAGTLFTTWNAKSYKTPVYAIKFDGEPSAYATHYVGMNTDQCKQYISNITGLAQAVTPEEGKASVSSLVITILDKNDEITALIATDDYYFHRKKCTVYAGYAGPDGRPCYDLITGNFTLSGSNGTFDNKHITGNLTISGSNNNCRHISCDGSISITGDSNVITYSDLGGSLSDSGSSNTKTVLTTLSQVNMLTIFTGWVTGIRMSADLLSYEFTLTDPQRWMQRKVFRGAETTNVRLSGNPINILLRILLSTGAGTNGQYDTYPEVNSLGIDATHIDVSGIEDVRDKWFPGDSFYMSFLIREREQAKSWIEREILKPLNCYPVVDGEGRYSIKPFKPPIVSSITYQDLDKSNIIGLPTVNHNLDALINEVEVHYDYSTDGNYDTEEFHIDSDSVNNRGPGKKPLAIKSRGIHTTTGYPEISKYRTADIVSKRANRVFSRFATPPQKFQVKTLFSRMLSEAGDIPNFSHPDVPNTTAGTRGPSNVRVEVINRSIDWRYGTVSLTLLETGFAKQNYGAVSPSAIVSTSTATNRIIINTSQAANIWSSGWNIAVYDAGMRRQSSKVTITSITTTTSTGTPRTSGLMMLSSALAATPSSGWIITFPKYDDCSTAQQKWAFVGQSTSSYYNRLSP